MADAGERPQTADDVMKVVQRARRPLHPPLVHRRARPAEELLDQRLRARGRVRGRDGLRRLLDHRLQPDRGVGHDRDARPVDLRASCPGAPRRRRPARMFCDVQVPGGEPYEGDPRWILRRALKRAEEMGFDAYNIGPELEYFYFRSAKPEDGAAGDPRRGRLLRPDDARRRLGRAPRDDPGARAARHPRRVRPPRGRPLPARGRHALQGRARDVGRLHDLPDRRSRSTR